MLTSVYDAHKNKNNDKRVISIAQLCLSAVLKKEAGPFWPFHLTSDASPQPSLFVLVKMPNTDG